MTCDDCDARVKRLNKIWPTIVLLALFVGIFWAGKFYQDKANEVIWDNCISNNPVYVINEDGSYSWNESHPDVKVRSGVPDLEVGGYFS